jgi:hypothetical protein
MTPPAVLLQLNPPQPPYSPQLYPPQELQTAEADIMDGATRAVIHSCIAKGTRRNCFDSIVCLICYLVDAWQIHHDIINPTLMGSLKVTHEED